jgi:recombination protein RecT
MTTTKAHDGTEIVKYNPEGPIGSPGGLKKLLASQRESIAQALPRHVTPERLIKTLLVAANRNPMLLQCTQASVLETINRAAELGLDLSGTLGEAYAVPFSNNIKDENGRSQKKLQCTLIIGYRGLAKLAHQSGEIRRLEAEVVYTQDHFVYRKGTEFRLEFEPSLSGDRGKPIGAYALVETKAGGLMAEFMPVSDIEKIRQGAQSKDSPAWKHHWPEMARKTAFRRLAKWLPLSTEKFVAALEHDNQDYDLTDVLEAETTRPEGPRSKALLAELTQDTEEAAGRVEALRARAASDDGCSDVPGDDFAAEIGAQMGEPSDA